MAHPLLHERSVANENISSVLCARRLFAPPTVTPPSFSPAFLAPGQCFLPLSPTPPPKRVTERKEGVGVGHGRRPKIHYDRSVSYTPARHRASASATDYYNYTPHTHTITTQHTHSLMGDDDGPIQLVSYVLRSLRFAAVRRRLSCLSP